MDKFGGIKAVARNLNDLIVDTTPASLTGTSIDADELIHPITDQLRGYYFYAYEGAGAGQSRTTTQFLPANNRLIFDQAFSTTPSTNTNFTLFKHFKKSDYDNAFDRAMGVARIKNLEEKVATVQLVATQFEYLVPSGYEYISMIKLVPADNTNYSEDDEVNRIYELPPRFWNILPNASGSFMIKFDSRKIDMLVVDQEWANIVGQAKPPVLGTDNATIPEALEEFLISGASMMLASQRVKPNTQWESLFRLYRDNYRELESYVHTSRHGRRVG